MKDVCTFILGSILNDCIKNSTFPYVHCAFYRQRNISYNPEIVCTTVYIIATSIWFLLGINPTTFNLVRYSRISIFYIFSKLVHNTALWNDLLFALSILRNLNGNREFFLVNCFRFDLFVTSIQKALDIELCECVSTINWAACQLYNFSCHTLFTVKAWGGGRGLL